MAQLSNLIVNGVAKMLSTLYVSGSVTAPTFIGKLQGNADSATKVNGHTVNSDVPSGAKFTDTTYSIATQSANGLMSAADKKAFDRTLVRLNANGTSIPSKANLNTVAYLAVGNYHCDSNSAAQTLTNCPTSEAFHMDVYSFLSIGYDNESSGKYVYRIRKITTYKGHMYIQYANAEGTAGNFGYSAWYRIWSELDHSHKQAYTASECSDFTSDENTMGITPAAVKKAITETFTPKSHTHSSITSGNYNTIGIRGYTGTPSSAAGTSGMFLQCDFTNNCVNVGIDGLGAIGVNYARSAGSVAWGNVSSKPSLIAASGGNLTGALNFCNKTWNLMGDDCYIGDNNVSGAVCFKGRTGNTALVLYNKDNTSNYGYIQYLTTNEMYIGNATQISILSNKSVNVRNAANSGWQTINASSFATQSSKRYKKNIKDMPEEMARNILSYRVATYDYINEADGTNCEGLIAEEVVEIDDYPVIYNTENQPEALDYSRFIPQLIKMVQIQQNEINSLKKKVNI